MKRFSLKTSKKPKRTMWQPCRWNHRQYKKWCKPKRLDYLKWCKDMEVEANDFIFVWKGWNRKADKRLLNSQ